MLPMILGLMLMMPLGAQSAPDRSFRELVDDCRVSVHLANDRFKGMSGIDASLSAYCVGYLRGAVDFLYLAAAPIACVPVNVTAEELARVIVKIADQQPDLLHQDMSLGVGRALALTYPCPKEKAD